MRPPRRHPLHLLNPKSLVALPVRSPRASAIGRKTAAVSTS